MKKFLALLMAVLMLVLMAAGCGSSEDQDASATTPDAMGSPVGAPTRVTLPPWLFEPDETEPAEPAESVDPIIQPTEAELPLDLEEWGLIPQGTELQHNDLKYVMIYNPYIYNQKTGDNPALSTGNFGNQIVVDMNRAEGLPEIPEILPYSFDDLNPNKISGSLKAGQTEAVSKVYRKGDKETFYTFPSDDWNKPRIKQQLTCSYAGTYCNIWVYNNMISDADARICGQEFDNNIYKQMVEKFGEPRFNGKINYLYYPLQNGLGGCFSGADLYTDQEVREFGYQNLGCNTNINLVHINARYGATTEHAISTMAHELQHLLCYTSCFFTEDYSWVGSWFNEAMSGYVENMIYPGIQQKAGRMQDYMNSKNIRYGQSMYNFTADYANYEFGAYGSVYLYAQYLEALAGEDVFSNFYQYWRTAKIPAITEAQGLAGAVPENVFHAVDQSFRYPTAIMLKGFANRQEEFMSKLTLQFYLDMLDTDATDPADFRDVNPKMLTYDRLTAAQIEGGGRIILALKGNSYEIPALADKGLIYVGLDENFKVLNVCYN